MKTAVFFLALFALSACTTPQRTTAPNADVVAALANVTQTAASGTMQADRVRQESAQSTRNAEINATATHGAYIATATQSVIGTQSAIVAATATTSAFNREQIELEALTTRRHAETVATIESIAIETTREYTTAQRVKWSRDWGIGILLFGLFLFTIALFVVLYNTGAKIGRVDGELVTIIEQPQQALPAPHNPEPMRFRRGEFATEVDKYRRPFELKINGDVVHIFSGKVLDAMEKSIRSGDIGFRRKTSAAGYGMGHIAGLGSGDVYGGVLSAMKERGFVEYKSGGNWWTLDGVKTVLDMDSLPQS